MLRKILSNTIVRLVLAILIGLLVGLVVNESVLEAIMIVEQITGQTVFFLVPLVVPGLVVPSTTRLRNNAFKVLLFASSIAYLSSVSAATFGAVMGCELMPRLHIQTASEGLKGIPPMLFNLEIPPVMSVVLASVLAMMLELSTAWVKSEGMGRLPEVFQNVVLKLVERVLILVLPFSVAASFCVLSYEETTTKQLPILLSVLLIAIICHYIWLTLLYVITSIYSRKNGWSVLKYYGLAYLAALGTMSSAATSSTALTYVKKSKILREEVISVTVPPSASVHLCGSILTEVSFVLTVSRILYGSMPNFTMMFVFIILLGFFAIGAPSIPGDTVLTLSGLIITVLSFDEAGTTLLLAIFALQDSFGTACSVTGDGAPTLITDMFSQEQMGKASTTL